MNRKKLTDLRECRDRMWVWQCQWACLVKNYLLGGFRERSVKSCRTSSLRSTPQRSQKWLGLYPCRHICHSRVSCHLSTNLRIQGIRSRSLSDMLAHRSHLEAPKQYRPDSGSMVWQSPATCASHFSTHSQGWFLLCTSGDLNRLKAPQYMQESLWSPSC
jgi:hypothetical protein